MYQITLYLEAGGDCPFTHGSFETFEEALEVLGWMKENYPLLADQFEVVS